MIRIRLRRVGKKRHPYYRLVVANQQAKRDGAFLETLGSYDPHADPPALTVDEAKTREWLGKGAQPSEAAEKILRRAGIVRGGATAVADKPAAATAVIDAPAETEATPAAETPAEAPAKRTRARKPAAESGEAATAEEA